jgi:hypothetical protein
MFVRCCVRRDGLRAPLPGRETACRNHGLPRSPSGGERTGPAATDNKSANAADIKSASRGQYLRISALNRSPGCFRSFLAGLGACGGGSWRTR